MTTELQRVMARYEDARIAYKKAVLASLNGDSSGDSIRQAISDFQSASADLQRIRGAPTPKPRTPAARPRMPVVARPRASRTAVARNAVPAWTAKALAAASRIQLPSLGAGLFRRLLSAE